MVSLPDMLRNSVLRHPERAALREGGIEISYAAMWQAVSGLAGRLKMLGVRRVGLCGDNTAAWILADLACLLADVVCVPVPVFFSESQFRHLQRTAGLDCLLFSTEQPDSLPMGHDVWLRQVSVAPGHALMPEQTAKITFTSGSTGTPKGVCLSARQMAATTGALQDRLAGVSLKQHLCILPLATLLENIAGVYLPLVMGATINIAPLQSLGMTGWILPAGIWMHSCSKSASSARRLMG
jgi:long-subunit acyl-CoA synthetase (AMP-forming)